MIYTKLFRAATVNIINAQIQKYFTDVLDNNGLVTDISFDYDQSTICVLLAITDNVPNITNYVKLFQRQPPTLLEDYVNENLDLALADGYVSVYASPDSMLHYSTSSNNQGNQIILLHLALDNNNVPILPYTYGGASPVNDSWLLGGNTNGVEETIGTLDNNDFPVVTFGDEVFRFGVDGLNESFDSSGNRYLSINPTDGLFEFGDLDSVVNHSYLHIDTTNLVSSFTNHSDDLNTDIGISASSQLGTNFVWVGNVNINSLYEQFDLDNEVYTLVDVDGFNDSGFVFDSINQNFVFGGGIQGAPNFVANPVLTIDITNNEVIIDDKLKIGGAIDPTMLILNEQSSDPANEANKGVIYTKDDGGLTQLFYEDSFGNTYQLTPSSGGTNIYNSDGELTGNRIIDLDGNELSIRNTDGTYLQIIPSSFASRIQSKNDNDDTFSFLRLNSNLNNNNINFRLSASDGLNDDVRIHGDAINQEILYRAVLQDFFASGNIYLHLDGLNNIASIGDIDGVFLNTKINIDIANDITTITTGQLNINSSVGYTGTLAGAAGKNVVNGLIVN